MITTSVERVALDWGKPSQTWVDRLTVAEARGYLAEGGHFMPGSMAPKIEACIEFLERGGGEAIITARRTWSWPWPARRGRASSPDADPDQGTVRRPWRRP